MSEGRQWDIDTTKMGKIALKKLRKRLPPNGVVTLMERTGLSRSMVNMVLRGERNNYPVIEMAIELAEEYKLAQQRLNQRIDAV